MNKKSQVLHDLRPGMGINITLHANLNKYLSSHIFIVLFHTKIAFKVVLHRYPQGAIKQ